MTRPARVGSSPPLCSASCLPRGAGLHAGGPHLALRLDTAKRAVLLLDDQTIVVHVGDHRVELDLDAELLERLGSLAAELPAVHGQHGRGAVEEHDARFTRIDLAERAVQRSTESSAICPANSTPVGPAPTTDEGEQGAHARRDRPTVRPVRRPEDFVRAVRGRRRSFSFRGRELRELVVAEVRLTGTGCHDQTVERRNSDAFEQPRGHASDSRDSMVSTSPCSTCAFFCLRSTSLVAGAMSPTERDAGRNLIEERPETDGGLYARSS